MYEYAARVVKVIDGDTVDLTIDLGLRVSASARCRLNGLNAPEKSTPEGREAAAFLTKLLPVDAVVLVRTFKDRTEKFGRWLAQISVAGQDVGELLIEHGYAKIWDGQGARPV